jgi:hypothetical protein
MSMALVAYAVPPDLARQLLGSRSRAVVNRMLRVAGKHFAQVDEYIRQQVSDGNWEAESPSMEVVFRDMVYGRPVDGRWSFQWAEVVEASCSVFGEFLNNSGFSPVNSRVGEVLDTACERARIPATAFGFTRFFLSRGLILPAPNPSMLDGCAGHMAAKEIRRARRAFDRGKFEALSHDDRHALGVVRGWFAMCDTLGWELATFFS